MSDNLDCWQDWCYCPECRQDLLFWMESHGGITVAYCPRCDFYTDDPDVSADPDAEPAEVDLT